MATYTRLVIFLTIYYFQFVVGFNDMKTCHDALGMQSGKIAGSQLSVSSMRNRMHGADEARIRTERNGGAWCTRLVGSQDHRNSNEYIQVNLIGLFVINGIETQGKFGGGGAGKEFVESYRIEYSREPLSEYTNQSEWIRYKNRDGIETLKGNDNAYTPEMRELDKPIIARQIRLIPIYKTKKQICLRLELYGCPFKDDIQSYELKDGLMLHKLDYNFQDKIYDGQKDYVTDRLYNGHGLLTDGEFGNDDFKVERYGIKGYDWLGWRNDTQFKVKFNFDTMRNFTLCIIYVNNKPDALIELFSYARFKFSTDGVTYESELNMSVNRDLDMDMARPILIPLSNNYGQYVEIDFGFYSKYLLISEITFESTKVSLNYHKNETTVLPFIQPVSTVAKSSSNGGGDYMNNLSLKTLIMALICSVLFLILIILVTFYYLTQLNTKGCNGNGGGVGVQGRRRRRNCLKFLFKKSSSGASTLSHEKPMSENKSIESGSYESTYLYPSLKYNMLATMHRNQPKSILMGGGGGDYVPVGAFNIATLNNAGGLDMQAKFMKFVSINNAANGANGSNLYYTIKPTPPPAIPPPPMPLMQTLSHHKQEFISIRKISASSLTFLDKIGESLVSNFYVGQISTDGLTSDKDQVDKRENVLIKVLKSEHDASLKYGFDNDLDLQVLNKIKLQNTNIIELLGICDDPYCYIMDFYSNKFNLNEFLLNEYRTNETVLTYSNVLSISVQVSNAMSYLESVNKIHKDVSCKNCVIYVNNPTNKPLNQLTKQDLTVKLCDISRYIYDHRTDYSILLTPEQQQQPLRLRWCAWETICTGKFTIKSDIWSFAVLLFELQTMCSQLPYGEYTDENLLLIINQQTQQKIEVENYLVKQIEQCNVRNLYTKELFDLMCQCWNLNLFDRPTFKDINLFLNYQLNGLSS